MNIIPFASESLTMSSREIAELTSKRHPDVRRDIRVMLVAIGKGVSSFAHTYRDAQNKEQEEYRLDRELTLTLVSGYDIPLRHRVVTRLAELEKNAAFAGLPDFSNPAAAARAWAEQVEQKALVEKQRDEAIATKAQIGSRREATAMATAAAAKRKAETLEVKLDTSKMYATVKRVERATGVKFNWRILKRVADEIGIPPMDVFDQNYGSVKSYHAEVWRKAFSVEISEDDLRIAA